MRRRPRTLFAAVNRSVSHIHTESAIRLWLNIACMLFPVRLQALGGRWPNGAQPHGELRTPGDPVDSSGHHHHASLCRVRWPAGLADPAQKPVAAESVGGEM